ncbi:MAG: glycosyltransferase [Elusimicrobiota bacterium]
MLSVSVVVPTYNERENIKLLLPLIHEALQGRPHEILVVDDSSPDGTGAVVGEIARGLPQARLLTKPTREGIGAALRSGYDRAACDVILSMDADLSFSPADIPRLLEQIERGCDLVLGSRHSREGRYETPNAAIALKHAFSICGNAVVRALCGVDVRDFSANFRAIRAPLWRKIQTRENTNALLMEMILKVRHCGGRIKEVPVSFTARRFGRSKLNLWIEAPKFLVKLLYYSIRLRVLGRP